MSWRVWVAVLRPGDCGETRRKTESKLEQPRLCLHGVFKSQIFQIS